MNKTRELTIASMSLALGIILPQAFHMVPNAGIIFLPMHIPILICAFLLSPLYAFLVGTLCPIISHFVFQMPPTMMLGQMIVELSIYGLSASIFKNIICIKNDYLKTYIVLIISMLLGRLAYGLMNYFFFKASEYSFSIWLSTAFITSLPGILIQLIIIPILVINAKKIIN